MQPKSDSFLVNRAVLTVARGVLEDVWTTPRGALGLMWSADSFWEWYGERWVKRSERQVRSRVWCALENKKVLKRDTGNLVPLRPDGRMVDDVVDAMMAIVDCPLQEMPEWLGDREGRPDPGKVIPLRDVLVSVGGGEVTVLPRDEGWFGPVCNAAWDPEARCPRWERCLGEWGEGDPVWAELLERWMGYCLMASREHARWLLMYGVTRGGKGTIDKVLKFLLGRSGFWGGSLTDLASQFGLEGIEDARVVSVTEAQSLEVREGSRASRVIKNLVGNDEIAIDRKFRGIIHKRVHAAPMVSANHIPRLPNEAGGLSSKMLVLPFRVSFLNKEDLSLEGTLRAEAPGIVKRLVSAAARLEAAPEGERWPVPEEGARAAHLWKLENSPLEMFLAARFVPSPDGFVIGELIWNEYLQWVRETGMERVEKRNLLMLHLEQRTSWNLRRHRTGHDSSRGLRGLSLRKNPDNVL